MVAELFSNALKRSIERNFSVTELLSTSDKLSAAGEAALVANLYRTWIEHNRDNPLLYAVYFNYGVVLSNLNDVNGARAALSEAIRVNPDFLPPYINLGTVLERMGAGGDGVLQWYTIVNKLTQITGDNVGYKTTALKQIGRVLEKGNIDVNAEEALRMCLDINPNQPDAIQHWFSLRQRQCKWPVIQAWANMPREKLVNGISALSLAAYTDDPLMQLGNAYMYGRYQIGQAKKSFVHTHPTRLKGRTSDRLRIGYLSSDLREHAIGFLTAEMYALHDRSKVEVFAYYCGHSVTDTTHARIKASVDHWVDISEMSDEQAAQRMVDDGIDILVDINGYTNSARTKVIAMRPAPVIVNWLGFPGTVATIYHNYIIADDTIIPKDSELYYTEKVLRLPCYQPNDRKRVVSQRMPARAEFGLPENAMVYCCFNGPHKITPFTWARWMSILKQVPNSVLWLLEGIETTNTRLKELAQQHGIAPERIIFAGKKINSEHLARYPLADLFLDTSPYGAHTTSSDAMWMGVPVITLMGRSFAARVCGSLVRAAGIGELVCDTPEKFVSLAAELGNNRPKLEAIRKKLQAGRDKCVLFDTTLLVASLEKLYAEMWADFKAGKLPKPNLTNLDLYNDIGVELDADNVEMLTVKDYQGQYRQKLADKSLSCFVQPDGRLWNGEGSAN